MWYTAPMHNPDSVRSRVWAPILVAVLLGCGGSSSADQHGTDTSGGEVTTDDITSDLSLDDDDAAPEAGTTRHHASAAEVLGLTPPETPWGQMDAQARNDYMIGKVLPIMDEAFRNQDPSRYGELLCENCHGPNPEERHYAMPDSHILAVGEPGSRAWTGMEAIYPDMVQFMQNEVVPKMTSIMGEDITCASCHPAVAAAH